MRLALVSNFFRPRTGGSAHFTEELAKELGRRGHDVLVVTSAVGQAPGESVEDGYGVLRLPAWTLPPLRIAFHYTLNVTCSPHNLRRLWRRLDELRPAVVHLQNQIFDLSLQAELWAIRRRVPVVATIHTALVHSDRRLAAVLAAVDHTLVHALFRLSRAHVVAPDRFMDGYVRRRYRRPARCISNIPIGVDVGRFAGDGGAHACDARARHGVGDRPLVLSVGHVIPMFRDRLALVEALPRLRQLVPDVVVLVVGQIYDHRFLARAEELGVRDAIVLAGDVPKHEIPAYVVAADVETHDLEGWGLGTASMEVMAAGVPVVASVRTDNFPGLELRDRDSLVLVPRGDATALADTLAALLADAELRHEMGRRQAAFARRHFSIGSVTDQYVALYERLAAERPAFRASKE
ncbi:MAG: glycosyltransferase family 4 protein [Deltaproteobacteria bacterium]|nr:glycosyltransferase family 4 protein [Deltaproteobacteria bacterium]